MVHVSRPMVGTDEGRVVLRRRLRPADASGRRRPRRGPISIEFLSLTSVFAWLGLTIIALIGGFIWAGDSAIAELTTREVDVELRENFEVFPDIVEIPQFTDLVLNIENVDTIQHDLQVTSSIGTRRLKPGEATVLPVGYIEGDIVVWCSIKGHREQGMEALITVENDEPIGDADR